MSQENVRVRTAFLAAVIALVLAGCDDDEDSTTEATPSPEQKIEQTGNKWAPLFAAAADRAACRYMTQPACEQMTCERISGPIKNCTPRSSGFRKSFANARVERIVLEDDKRPGGDRNRPAGVRYAAAEFSNGELVEFWTNPGRNWLIDKLGGNAGRRFFEQTTTEATLSPEQKIERTGNKWAPLFAAAPNPEACAEFDELHPYREVAAKYMTQPACEQVVCERVATGPIKNCTPSSSGFQKSFADATVRDVAIKGNRAGAKFANGEAVEFVRDPVSEFSSDWPITRLAGTRAAGSSKPPGCGSRR